jgi:magnesium transporter
MERFKSHSYYPLSDGIQESSEPVRSEHGGSLEGSLKRNLSVHASLYDIKHGTRMPARIKKSRVMRWLVLSHTGDRQLLNLEKRQLQQAFSLDLPVRDMRLLDSQLVDFKTIGQILVRNNVILVSMEHVRCIITAKEVIVPVEDNEKSEVCARFCMWLESMVQEYVAEATLEKQRLESEEEEEEREGEGSSTPSLFSTSRPPISSRRGPLSRPRNSSQGDNRGKLPNLTTYNETPFELHVLEVALGEVSTHLAREAEVLQAQAHPALEELTKEADQPVLERVRRIKTSHQRLLGRVRLVRDVLERLMEDDDDMMRMTLTRSLNLTLQQRDSQLQRGLSPAASGQSPILEGSGFAFPPTPNIDLNPSLAIPAYSKSPSLSFRGQRARLIQEAIVATEIDADDDASHDLMDVENLLESFFMHVDSTLYSLVQLGELVEDTVRGIHLV